MPLLLLQLVHKKDALNKCLGTKNSACLQSLGIIYPFCILITDAKTHASITAVERACRQGTLLMSHTKVPALLRHQQMGLHHQCCQGAGPWREVRTAEGPPRVGK